MNLKRYTFVLLRRPDDAPGLPEPELERIQLEHLAFLGRMAEEGHLVGAGPFSDQPDESLRGLCVYVTGLEETRRLAAQDPAVRAGRLVHDVMSWWTEDGAITFHREFTVS